MKRKDFFIIVNHAGKPAPAKKTGYIYDSGRNIYGIDNRGTTARPSWVLSDISTGQTVTGQSFRTRKDAAEAITPELEDFIIGKLRANDPKIEELKKIIFDAYTADRERTEEKPAQIIPEASEADSTPEEPENIQEERRQATPEKPRTAYRVQCKAKGSPRPFINYSEPYAAREAAEECKARAEAIQTYSTSGAPIIYRIKEEETAPGEMVDNNGHYKTGRTVEADGIFYTEYSNSPALNPYLWESRTESGRVIVSLSGSLDECRQQTREKAARYIEEVQTGEREPEPEALKTAVILTAPRVRYVFRTYAGWTVYDPQTGQGIIEARNDAEAAEIAKATAAGRAFTCNRAFCATA